MINVSFMEMACECWVVVLVATATLCHGASFISKDEWDPYLQVTTNSGIIQGSRRQLKTGEAYFSYRGIPYGQAPVGKLRFRAPRPAKKWTGVLNAIEDGPKCVQLFFRIHSLDNFNFTTFGQEDCLFLSVHTPKNPQEIIKPLPVMVWIYGGAFVEGHNSYKLFDPEFLLEDGGVIVVTFNYRVGVFGFLSTEDLESPGNYGLKDQLLAVQWVKDNIRYFGGDSSRITVFGESAGAASAHYLMMSPRSEGLINNVIAQSGSALCTWAFQRNPRKVAFDVAVAIGVRSNSTKELVAKLRKAKFSQIEMAEIGSFIVNLPLTGMSGIPFAPSLEPEHPGAIISRNNFEVLASGRFNKVPVIIGVNKNEASIFLYHENIGTVQSVFSIYDLSPQLLVKPSFNLDSLSCRSCNSHKHPLILKDMFTCRREVGLEIHQHYFKSKSFISAEPQDIIDFITDDMFRKPVSKAADLMGVHVPVYFYEFTYEGEAGSQGIESFFPPGGRDRGFGPSHSEEVWYLFRQEQFKNYNTNDKLVSNKLVRLWTNFAKCSTPTPTFDPLLDGVFWKKWNAQNNYPYLDINAQLTVRDNFNYKSRVFWDELYRRHSKGPIGTY